MLKQILAKLPRKSSKCDSFDSSGSHSCNNTTNTGSSGIQFTNSCTVIATRLNVVKRMSTAIFPVSSGESVAPHVPFKDVSSAEKQTLFIAKLNLCCSIYDFDGPDHKDSTEKDLKRQVLLELNDFVTSGSAKFTDSAIAAVCKMCAVNLFRTFPPKCTAVRGGENEDEEPVFDPAWCHLQLVYDLFLNIVGQNSLDPKVAKKYVDHSFMSKLLDLFDSEDPRERECLKSILHRLYGKFMMHRPYIRKSVSNIFYRFAFETERHNGIAELLEVFGSVISGFALPLKEEHRVFLSSALMPLHKPKCLGVYHQQLAYCVMQFVEKEQNLAGVVIKRLLRYWPVKSSQKQLMFISELEELLEMISVAEFEKIMVPLFRRIGYCLNSSHYQVAERAHFLWNNEHVLNLVMHNRRVIMPIIVSALERNSQNHWNKTVLNLTQNVKKVFSEMDEELVLDCQGKLEEENSKSNVAAERRKLTWERLEIAANYQPVTMPSNISGLVKPSTCLVSC